MKFTINLATKIYIDRIRLRLILSAATVILFLCLFLNIRTLTANNAESGRLSKDLSAQEAKFSLANKGVPEKEYQALLEKINFANSLIDKKSYNWLDLLDNLEQVVPDGLAITSIEPDQKGQGVNFSGVARKFSNLQTFMEHLEGSSFFTNVYLSSQKDQKLKDNSQGITFSLSCHVAMK